MSQTKPSPTSQKPVSHQATNPLVTPNSSLTITLKWSQVEPVRNKVERQMAKSVKQAGFRQGKVPLTIAKTYLNPEAVIESTLEKLLPDAFVEQVKNLPEMPIVPPEYVVKKAEIGQDWQVTANYAVRPKVELGKYQTLVKSAIETATQEYEKYLQTQAKAKSEKKSALPKTPSQDYLLSAIYKKLVSTLKPPIQELLVRRETLTELDNLAQKLKSVNLSFEEYLKKSHLTFEGLQTELAAQSLARLQLIFILQVIAQKAELSVSELEIDGELKDQKTNQQYRSMAREHLLRHKIAQHLLAVKT